MIHAYAFEWRCLMHEIIIEIREKACVHVHHTRVEKETIVSHYTESIRKLKREANGMKRSQIKWKLLLFDESDFFSFKASLFFILF